MKSAPPHPNEAERIQALRDADLLDTAPEQGFDDLVQVASTLCGTPMALVSLVDTDRQWFKARVGLDAEQTSREVAFCAHAIHGQALFMVENALDDGRFADNPLVAGAPDLRFYAGTPLITAEGHALGTLCVLDIQPRQLSPEIQAALEALGRQVVAMITLRTAHRRLQREVHAREVAQRQTRALLEASASGMVVVDRDGILIQVNQEAERLFGRGRVELIGSAMSDLVVEVERLAELREEFAAAPVARPIGSGLDFTLRHADGHGVPVELGLARIDVDDGAASVVTLVDLTSRRAVETMKNEFISVVSHELRTPLTSIRGSLRLLEAGVKGELPEPIKPLIHIASTNTERLIRLINDILDIEKIEAGKLELQLENVAAATLCKSAIDNVRGVAVTAGVTLAMEAHPSLSLTVDVDRVTQVLVNLISNAVKFSPEGGTVRVSARAAGGSLRFEVQDEGPGIPQQDIHRLFGKFQQLDASDQRARGGTGLGLAISKAIVEAHSGQIGVHSSSKGSTFWFELASWDMSLAAEPSRVQPAPHDVSSARPVALLVEDDPDAATVIRAYLEQERLDVEVVGDIGSARDHLGRQPPSVVFLDLHLPDGHGFELVQWMRGRPDTKEIPVIVLSGSERPGGFSGPFLVDWLAKPLDDGDLSSAIRRAGLPQLRPKVLVVEDDASMREIMSSKLDAMGTDCRTAGDGRAALGILQTFQADLIVLDVGLPIVDGYSVVDILRQGPHRNTPLIVYSGRDLTSDEREALRLGVTRFVTKAGTDDGAFLRSVGDLLASVLPASVHDS